MQDTTTGAQPLSPAQRQERGVIQYTNMLKVELARAQNKHKRGFASSHEGYAVILEELDEAWDEIKINDIGAARREIVQVGAMCLRFLIDTEEKP